MDPGLGTPGQCSLPHSKLSAKKGGGRHRTLCLGAEKTHSFPSHLPTARPGWRNYLPQTRTPEVLLALGLKDSPCLYPLPGSVPGSSLSAGTFPVGHDSHGSRDRKSLLGDWLCWTSCPWCAGSRKMGVHRPQVSGTLTCASALRLQCITGIELLDEGVSMLPADDAAGRRQACSLVAPGRGSRGPLAPFCLLT